MTSFQFFIVDDHKMLSSGLASFLTAKFPLSSCLASFESQNECLAFLNGQIEMQNIIAVVDLNLAGNYSFPLIKELASRKIKVLVYTMFESSAFAMRAVECGASAYALKGESETELVNAIENILDGKTFITPSLEKNFVQIMKINSAFSPKEKIVAQHLMEGLDNAQIASAMNISKRSVENYLSHMYDKTGVLTRDELKKRLR